jgi:hypothetical protein
MLEQKADLKLEDTNGNVLKIVFTILKYVRRSQFYVQHKNWRENFKMNTRVPWSGVSLNNEAINLLQWSNLC